MKIWNVFGLVIAGITLGFLSGCDQNDDKANTSGTQSQVLADGSVVPTEKVQPQGGTSDAVIYGDVTDTNYFLVEYSTPVIQNPDNVVTQELTNQLFYPGSGIISNTFTVQPPDNYSGDTSLANGSGSVESYGGN